MRKDSGALLSKRSAIRLLILVAPTPVLAPASVHAASLFGESKSELEAAAREAH
jgi:hypothetical protein